MAIEKTPARRSEKDERKPRDARSDQAQANPPFLSEGPERVRDSYC